MATQTKTTSGLDALLGATLDLRDTVYIPRLKTSFTIKALTDAELRSASEQATIPGAKGAKSTDDRLFNALIIVKGCVDPEFSNKALQTHYGATDPADCVQKALLPGESAKVLAAILALSGFSNEEETIEDAKN